MKQILMPSFGSDMAKGMVAEWKVSPGDRVKKGDIIAVIETMKGLIDMEVFEEGVIVRLLAPVGEELIVGTPIAELKLDVEGEGVEGKTESAPDVNDTVKKTPPPEPPVYAKQPHAVPLTGNTRAISPAARKKARQLGIDWHSLPGGRGPDGALVLADIEAVGPEQIAPAGEPQREPSDKAQQMRQAVADVVSQSKREIPHYYLADDICLDTAMAWLEDYNNDRPPEQQLLVNALIYTAIARALSQFPMFNGFYRDARFEPQNRVHLGNAISLREGGLLVAAIHDADTQSAPLIMEKLKDQVIRARQGSLRMSERQDATVTVSNLGDRGVDRIFGVIFPPQVALIGVGRVRLAPWAENGELRASNIVSLSLAADHRVSDGHDGARLLSKINKLLQKPEKLA